MNPHPLYPGPARSLFSSPEESRLWFVCLLYGLILSTAFGAFYSTARHAYYSVAWERFWRLDIDSIAVWIPHAESMLLTVVVLLFLLGYYLIVLRALSIQKSGYGLVAALTDIAIAGAFYCTARSLEGLDIRPLPLTLSPWFGLVALTALALGRLLQFYVAEILGIPDFTSIDLESVWAWRRLVQQATAVCAAAFCIAVAKVEIGLLPTWTHQMSVTLAVAASVAAAAVCVVWMAPRIAWRVFGVGSRDDQGASLALWLGAYRSNTALLIPMAVCFQVIGVVAWLAPDRLPFVDSHYSLSPPLSLALLLLLVIVPISHLLLRLQYWLTAAWDAFVDRKWMASGLKDRRDPGWYVEESLRRELLVFGGYPWKVRLLYLGPNSTPDHILRALKQHVGITIAIDTIEFALARLGRASADSWRRGEIMAVDPTHGCCFVWNTTTGETRLLVGRPIFIDSRAADAHYALARHIIAASSESQEAIASQIGELFQNDVGRVGQSA